MIKIITDETLNKLIALGLPEHLTDYETIGEDCMGSDKYVPIHDANDWLLEKYGVYNSATAISHDRFIVQSQWTILTKKFQNQYDALLAGIEETISYIETYKPIPLS